MRTDGGGRGSPTATSSLTTVVTATALLQRGETGRLRVIVKNTGQGKATKPLLCCATSAGKGCRSMGRYDADPIPSEEKVIDFTFDVAPDFSEGNARVELRCTTSAHAKGVTDKLTFPVIDTSTPGQDASAVVAVRGRRRCEPAATRRWSARSRPKRLRQSKIFRRVRPC